MVDYLLGLLHQVPAGEDRDDYHWELDEGTASMLGIEPSGPRLLFGLKVEIVERYGIALVRR